MFRVFLLALLTFFAARDLVLAQDARVALVVGVSNYAHAPRLPNTLNDAQDMTAALRKVGFDVDLVLDPDRSALEAAVRRLGERSVGAATSLFFYSGHALEYGGRNWLVPVSAAFDTGRNVRFEALDIDSVLEQTDGSARMTLVMLDACRDNPFIGRLSARSREAPTRGLGRIESSATGVMISFSTAPGQVALDGTGRNSPFTGAMLKQIATPGLEIKALMTNVTRDVVAATSGKQRPWQNSSLEGDFYFVPPAAAPPPAPSVDTEIIFWNSVSASRDPADFSAYLARYPQGVFAAIARNRLNQIASAKPAEAPAPATRNEPVTPVAAAPGTPAKPQVQAAVAAPAVPAPTPAATPLRDKLTAGLAIVAPNWSANTRESVINGYLRENGAKALAFAPGKSLTWRVAARKDTVEAATAALESCQIYAGVSCALLTTNDTIEDAAKPGGLPTRDMPHVAWTGKFRPEFVPALASTLRNRADIAGYAALKGAKAAAYHPGGRLYIKTAIGDQKQTEEAALSACLADPANVEKKCYLYAASDWVVLPEKLTAARAQPTTLADAFSYFKISASRLAGYEKNADSKAIAIDPLSLRTWIAFNHRTAAVAEQIALEGCQIQFGRACVLLASGAALQAPDVFIAQPRPMPRVAYAGVFDATKIPVSSNAQRKEFVGYKSMPSPKAMALRASGSKIAIGSGKDKAEAQAKALAGCNQADDAYPCFIYAIDNQVVLPQRKPEPIK